MKIGYFADGPWSHKAFELIISDQNLQICFIVPRIDTVDETLKNYAKEYSIDYLNPVDINSIEFINLAKSYECDIFVSMSFNQIFKNDLINIPRLKTINCHAGKLPFYRGRNVLNWVLINDEKEFGITVHYIDSGIDTGDIILQKVFPITDEDNYQSLLERAYIECANILYQALNMISTNSVMPIKQSSIHPVGFYCGGRGKGDELINWNSTSREIFNFIRALSTPGPIATTYLCNSIVKINKAKLINNAPTYINKPGQILRKTDAGYLIKTGDSFIEIQEIQKEKKLKIGARFS